ncbi:hypothetical protein EDD11_006494 [Mortierella claussenii]|nr:hypothetical protein EDD11_006494 [Mortierella claussenii]
MGRKSGRSLNPADQYRKEQHKKEIKKNKQDRKKVREVNTALRDTTTETELAEYEAIEQAGKLDKDGVKKLAELREKMNKIIDIKKAHGIKIRSKKTELSKPVPVAEPVRDPTRSIYYDPVLNPYGAPPPGQPYLEYPAEAISGTVDQQQQPKRSDEDSGSDSSDDSSSDSDTDSDSSESDSEDLDDEDYMPPLPEGSAPTKEIQARYLERTKPKIAASPPPRIPQHPSPHHWSPVHERPGMYSPRPGMYPPRPPMNAYGPPMGEYAPPFGNPYPPGRPGPPLGLAHPSINMGPVPGGFPPGAPVVLSGYGYPGYHEGQLQHRPMRPPSQRLPPPPRFVKPPRTSDPQSDPMTGHLPRDEKETKRVADQKDAAAAKSAAAALLNSSSPGQTPAAHPLPPKPTTTQLPVKPALVAGPASISAEPQLRNLQKELVHLVPSTIMRKRVTQKGKIGRPVNAAPGVDEDDHKPNAWHGSAALSTAVSTSAPQNTNVASLDTEPEVYREAGLGLRLPKINIAPDVSSIFPRKIMVNSAPEVPVVIDRAAKKKAEYDEFLQGLEGDGLL